VNHCEVGWYSVWSWKKACYGIPEKLELSLEKRGEDLAIRQIRSREGSG
jgi:hypothetical protein